MVLEVRMVVFLVGEVTEQEHQEGIWNAGNVLLLDLSAGYVSVFTLWKFIKIYVYYLCTYLYVLYFKILIKKKLQGFPGGAVVENPPANAGDTGSSPGLGRSHMPRSN